MRICASARRLGRSAWRLGPPDVSWRLASPPSSSRIPWTWACGRDHRFVRRHCGNRARCRGSPGRLFVAGGVSCWLRRAGRCSACACRRCPVCAGRRCPARAGRLFSSGRIYGACCLPTSVSPLVNSLLLQYRFVFVIGLLAIAAALVTDRTRLPLALRGLKRVIGGSQSPSGGRLPLWRRLLAFAIVLAAFLIAVFPAIRA